MLDNATTGTTTTSLFDAITLGDIDLANRVVMAPMTRLRSGSSGFQASR